MGSLYSLFLQRGWQWLQEALDCAKARGLSSDAIGRMYLTAPAGRAAWNRLDTEPSNVQTAYWRALGWPNVADWNQEDVDFAAQHLIAVNRSPSAVEWLSYASPSGETIIRILDAVPRDLSATQDMQGYGDNFMYDVADLFKKLDNSEYVADEEIARLEIPYISVLHYHRPHMAFHKQVCRDASMFADLVCYTFRRSDGQQDEVLDDETRKSLAHFASGALWHLRGFPGKTEAGPIDFEVMSMWVDEPRRLCKERGREIVGDQQIGQVLANCPVGEDGAWPCEPVRDLLGRLTARHVGIGFTMGKHNLRGVTSKGIFDGGTQERSLADTYRKDASSIAAKWPFTAALLRELADGYTQEGQYEDQRADWSDQFEF